MTPLPLPKLGPIPAERKPISELRFIGSDEPLVLPKRISPAQPRPTHRKGHCIACDKDFDDPMRPGKVRIRCQPCRNAHKASSSKPRLLNGLLVRACTNCFEDFEQQRRHGHPLMKCPSCRSKGDA